MTSQSPISVPPPILQVTLNDVAKQMHGFVDKYRDISDNVINVENNLRKMHYQIEHPAGKATIESVDEIMLNLSAPVWVFGNRAAVGEDDEMGGDDDEIEDESEEEKGWGGARRVAEEGQKMLEACSRGSGRTRSGGGAAHVLVDCVDGRLRRGGFM